MSWMKGDLLSKTRKLVGGLVTREPVWLKAMEASPPPVFPRSEGKIKKIVLPEDMYVRKFYNKYPESKYEGPVKIVSCNPDPERVFGMRVLELKEHGISEEEAMAVADMEYRSEKRAKKKAYKRMKELARMQGKKPPPKPYPTAVKEAPDRRHAKERFQIPNVRKLVNQLRQQKELLLQDGTGGGAVGKSNWINE
ncbi:PREDICTED: uncharacterized protein LOC104818198 [Tarenaya hassleriana]|uniref:uncharacterized protein LOC104818198 n=1 Tax=Tarenaya hassleriana TaxID=28532 RepID=UPI00053C5CA8|nr:PREDICTED: uncharacterized protein LOC104818198 [Tarenaya hassleriana]